ncbi:MAG: hypothetical protein HYY06_01260 [Deltaproteobacteria bacterium]|nr:hypothetical protein [Deltaproteobacteria bacterium]
MRLRVPAILAALLPLAGVVSSCSEEDVDEDEGMVSDDGFPDETRGSIAPIRGYYRGAPVELYDLGEVEPLRNADGGFAGVRVNPMYVMGDAVAEQRPIVDVIPASANYSSFFQVVEVEVEDGYEANEVKSQATLFRRGLRLTYTDAVVHCPLVASDAEPVIGPAAADRDLPVIDLWYRKKQTRCFLLEGGEALVARGLAPLDVDAVTVGDRITYTIPAQDIFIPEVRIFDEEVEVPGNIVTDLLPGDHGYSPVCLISEVKVRPTYQVGGFDDLADIDPTLIELRSPETYRDYPAIGRLP